MAQLVQHEWAHQLITSWDHWIELPVSIGETIGTRLIGALPGECVVADSTTVNIYKLAAAALDLRPDRDGIVVDPADFPTDRYVVDGLVAARSLRRTATIDDRTALVVRSLVDYRTGEVADMAAVTAEAHAAGALMMWDLSHAVGVMPVALAAHDVDLAVGCTYKYLNGGPGSPAFAYVNRRIADDARFRQPIWGWMGVRDVFAMGDHYEPHAGAAGVVTGSPTVTALVCIEEGVRITVDAGIRPIRAKSLALTELCIALAEERLAPLGFTVVTPRDAHRRGGHVSVARPDAKPLLAAWRDAGVLADFREPDVLRLGLSPLTTSFVDVWDAIDRLVAIEHAASSFDAA
jgi:kynureninase